jgi:hypothetical protein
MEVVLARGCFVVECERDFKPKTVGELGIG